MGIVQLQACEQPWQPSAFLCFGGGAKSTSSVLLLAEPEKSENPSTFTLEEPSISR